MKQSHVALLCGCIVIAPHLPHLVAFVVGMAYLYAFWTSNKADM